ncbi:MAG: iron-sulfur cluster assembly scaffold protein [Pseudomonadota bacterium]
MADQGLISLYSEELLRLAASMPVLSPLDDADARVKRRAPLCGSHIDVAVTTDGQKITGYWQDVNACALGQAAASVFAQHAVGADLDTVEQLRAKMSDMLKNNGEAPAAPFEDLRYLLAARDFKNRHDSIMLVFDATYDALVQAQKKASA